MEENQYTANSKRYENSSLIYRRCGHSGILLPKVSLGLWQNFGSTSPFDKSRQILHTAFDNGITHFDLANNYGPLYGTAEETFGTIMERDFRPYRD
ncbi:MAG: aldo/keto reductase, partial [Bacteroidaceae bacterium]|nr:aldo/keto reductase [Bacteroidaceae bacterium]